MFCPKCGESNAAHFKFCLHCGGELDHARAENDGATSPQAPAPAHHASASREASALVNQMLAARSASELTQLAHQLTALTQHQAGTWTGGDEPETQPPAPAPRPLPPQFYTRHVPPTAMFLLPFGSIFSLVGAVVGGSLLASGLSSGQSDLLGMSLLFGGIFGGIGSVCLFFGALRLLQTRRIWREGHIVIGRVTQVGIDRSTRINGRNPCEVDYTYEIEGRPYHGKSSSLSPALIQHRIGQPVHILYDPRRPDQSALAHGMPRALTTPQGASW